MHIGEWLNKLAEEEQEKDASKDLERMFDGMPLSEVIKIAQSDGHMSQQRRESLPSKQFAVPAAKAKKIGVAGEIKGEAKGKYPIPDEKHARNALARVSQFGTSAERQAVRQKVYSRYPGLKEHFAQAHGGANPTSKGNVTKQTQGGIKEAEARFFFMDKVARQIAHIRHETVKTAKCKSSEFGMEKEDAFTTPEAQAKAKVMTRAMKASKGAPTSIRKAAISVAGKQMSKSTK